GRDTPMVGPCLVGMAVALGIGLAINDSGIAIPALGVSLGVPLLFAATSTWMLNLRSQGTQAAQAAQVPSGPEDGGDGDSAAGEDSGPNRTAGDRDGTNSGPEPR